MGVDTFGPRLAGPENIAEVMKKDLDDANAKIKQMEKEIEILDGLFNECTRIIVDNRHLLALAEEPVIEPEPPLYFGEGPRKFQPFVNDKEAVEARNEAIRWGE
jgi:hypothetical protein